jgi:hypothetical protein
VTISELRGFSTVPIDLRDRRYVEPLRRDVEMLASLLKRNTKVVLLGSLATNKYLGVLCKSLGPKLFYPTDFLGRGDMSRGGLLLKAVREGEELEYTPVLKMIEPGKCRIDTTARDGPPNAEVR